MNSTVIGSYARPDVRLPGAGGAPEIAAHCGEVFIIMNQSRRAFVSELDFLTTFGHGRGRDDRLRHGITTHGPTCLVTDLCVMRPDPESREFVVCSLHPGVTREQASAATAWTLRFADEVAETPTPSASELHKLRDLVARTARAHSEQR